MTKQQLQLYAQDQHRLKPVRLHQGWKRDSQNDTLADELLAAGPLEKGASVFFRQAALNPSGRFPRSGGCPTPMHILPAPADLMLKQTN